jgi:hypothetical protein
VKKMAETTPKIKRGLSLSVKTNDDLLELCEHLGINPHNYIVNEVSKAVQRDRLSLMVKKHQEDSLKALMGFFENNIENKG